MRPHLLLLLLALAGCSVECQIPPSSSPTYPSAAKSQDATICLPAGFGVVGADSMGGFLLVEEQPARPRAYTTRHRRVVECGADARACSCFLPAEVAP